MIARLALLVFALLAVACGGPRTELTVRSAEGVDVDAAVLMWTSAVPGLHVTVVDGPADLRVVWGPPPDANNHVPGAVICAQLDVPSDTVYLNPGMTPECRARTVAVLAHEIGHYAANRTDHTSAHGLMFAVEEQGADDVTASDVAYLWGQ